MSKQSNPSGDTGKDVVEIRRKEQFTEALYALASILRAEQPVARRRMRRRGDRPNFRLSAA